MISAQSFLLVFDFSATLLPVERRWLFTVSVFEDVFEILEVECVLHCVLDAGIPPCEDNGTRTCIPGVIVPLTFIGNDNLWLCWKYIEDGVITDPFWGWLIPWYSLGSKGTDGIPGVGWTPCGYDAGYGGGMNWACAVWKPWWIPVEYVDDTLDE